MSNFVQFDHICKSRSVWGASGDHVHVWRSAEDTLILCVDGVGTGIKADIAANMTISRVKVLFENKKSLRKIFTSLAESMQRWRDSVYPFCAFLLARVYADGRISVMNYEYPDPIFFSQGKYIEPEHNVLREGSCIAKESFYMLGEDDVVFFISDGITQSSKAAAKEGATEAATFPLPWKRPWTTWQSSRNFLARCGHSLIQVPQFIQRSLSTKA
jgi:serine phosphatase RsbU (regulator of sigma subunit)